MKKLILIASVAFASFIISCNNNGGGMSAKAKKNLETNNAIMKMFETGDVSKIGDYIAADAVDHSGPNGEVKGLDNIKAMFQNFMSSMSDTKVEVVKELADDDYVMSWIKQTWTAKTDDPMMNLKAGQQGSMEGVDVSKYNSDGKAVEHWGFISMAEMMKMMQQPQMNNMGADTSKMNQ